MKKLILLLIVVGLLFIPAGCKKKENGNNGNNTNTNNNNNSSTGDNKPIPGGTRLVCTMKDSDAMTTITVDAVSDVIKKIFANMEMDMGDAASADYMMSLFSEAYKEVDKTEGFIFDVKKTADGKGIIMNYGFDFSYISYETMQGMFEGSEMDSLSLKAYKEELVSQGFTCK